MTLNKRKTNALSTDVAKRNADVLFDAVTLLAPGDHQVEPTEDGGYSMLIASDDGDRMVKLECDSDGGVLCIASIGDNLRRAKYYQMDGLPDGFIREALHDVISERDQLTPWTPISMQMKDFGGTYIQVDMPNLQDDATLVVMRGRSEHLQLEGFRSIGWTTPIFKLPQASLTGMLNADKVPLPFTGGLSFQPERLSYMEEP